MQVTIKPSRASGEIKAPPSKSMAHRLLICAGLCAGKSVIHNVAPSQDVLATIDCLSSLGAECEMKDNTVYIRGIDFEREFSSAVLPCNECGSTLRFFIPICLMTGKEMTLTGSKTLLGRPLSVYEKICGEQNLIFSKTPDSLKVCGKLSAGKYEIAGNISSQFISGLLFVLPLLGDDSIIKIIPPFESASYVKMTARALEIFGVRVDFLDDNTIKIYGNQRYKAQETVVEGDYSNAAFLDALNLMDSDVTVTGLDEKSLQGDRVYKEHLKALQNGKSEIDLSDCPDLGPVLFASAAAKSGAEFVGTARLKIKESDRGEAMASELRKFGADVKLYENTAVIENAPLHAPSEILSGHNDHRIVMALSVLLTKFGGTIDGAQAVNKSYPNFFDDLRSLGVEVEISELDK